MSKITMEGDEKLLKQILNLIGKTDDLGGTLTIGSEGITEEDLDGVIGMDGTIHL